MLYRCVWVLECALEYAIPGKGQIETTLALLVKEMIKGVRKHNSSSVVINSFSLV